VYPTAIILFSLLSFRKRARVPYFEVRKASKTTSARFKYQITELRLSFKASFLEMSSMSSWVFRDCRRLLSRNKAQSLLPFLGMWDMSATILSMRPRTIPAQSSHHIDCFVCCWLCEIFPCDSFPCHSYPETATTHHHVKIVRFCSCTLHTIPLKFQSLQFQLEIQRDARLVPVGRLASGIQTTGCLRCYLSPLCQSR